MRTVLLASLRHNRRRYVASALAVVIGVAFIVAVNGLAGSLRAGMTADVGVTSAGADWVVETSETEEARRITEAVRTAGGAAVATWGGWGSARSEGAWQEDLRLGAVADDERLQWQELVQGTVPRRDGEALVGERAQIERGIEVGDTLQLGTAGTAVEVRVVGVVDDPVQGRADLFLRPADAERSGAFWFEHVLVSGDRDSIPRTDAPILTRDEYVADLQAQITQGVDVIALLVTIFAVIALVVAVLVITNTFAILFAQRARDFALLRCVGVTKRQLRRSVRIEALVLGVVSSLTGAAIGAVLAVALTALAGVWVDVLGPASFQTPWVVGSLVVGVLVTVVAAWLPTRAVTRIAPLAALRPHGGLDPRSRAGILRTLLGLLVLGAGVASLAVVVSLSRAKDGPDVSLLLIAMLLGGVVAFLGVLLLGPLLVPAALRLLGRAVTRRGAGGAVARLATSNSVRNPRRTATTAASLMVGVTLTTAVLTGLASVDRSLDAETEQSYPLDVAVVPAVGTASGKDAALLEAVRAVEDVVEASTLPTARLTVSGASVTAVRVTGTEPTLRRHSDDAFEGADVFLPGKVSAGLGDAVRTEVDQLLVVGTGAARRELLFSTADHYGATTMAVRPDVFDELLDAGTLTEAAAGVVWVRARDGVDPSDLQTDLTRAASEVGVSVELAGDHETRDFIGTQMTVLTASVVGLLSIAVVIALIGIGNTLGLSVLERTQENSLLRAMGLTRVQLRRTLAWEGLLLAAVATLMGIVVGVAFAWVGVQVLVGAMMLDTSLVLPAWQLGTVVLVAVASGVLASVLPARRAARVSPAAGLSLA